MKKYQFTFIYSLPILVFYAFNQTGWTTFLPILFYFGVVPILELLINPDHSNASKELSQKMKNDPFYDWIIFLIIPIHISLLVYFLFIIKDIPFNTVDYWGRIANMGLMCGVIGINLGHELGHRKKRAVQFLGEILLLTSLNTHFLPYHNAGHHLNVATPRDSATAKKNEILFLFWFTSHFGSYIEAWKIENDRMKREEKSIFSFNNRMIIYTIANLVLLTSIYLAFGTYVLIAYIFSAIIGILLLETINYIEHYGLLRKKNKINKYEKVKHCHSWNSDHLLGRFLLFNLSRHSDHHYNGSKKYQLLNSVATSPQMPTGYPGMMILALFQPAWFFIMNKELSKLKDNG